MHNEITDKGKLFNNLKTYCKSHKICIDSIVPKTFILNVDSEKFESELLRFLDYFEAVAKMENLKNIWLLKPNDLNRGRGIHIFDSLKTLFQLLKDYGKEDILRKQMGNKIRFEDISK